MLDEEQQWIAAAQRGEIQSFNALVRAYESRAYNLCYRMLGDTESAADATQDTFFAAFRHIRSFRGGSFRSWLLRIATNTCYDVLRARKRRPTISLDIESDDESAHSPLQIADRSELPDEWVQRRELAAEIQRGLAALPEDQRAVVILCDIEGLAYEEIAQITGANIGTVKSRLSRGRARLRDQLRAGELLPARYRQSDIK